MAEPQQERSSNPVLPLVTLPLDGPHTAQLESIVGSTMGSIRQKNIFPRGMCYWNVAGVIRQHGGSMVLGWQCIWWPDRLLVAVHHAIWRKPNGTLIDITQKDYGDASSQIAFCPDGSIPVDLLWPMFVPNKYIVLSSDKDLCAAVDALKEQVEAAREVVSYVRLKHGSFSPGHGLHLPQGPLPTAIRNRIHTANQKRQAALNHCLEVQNCWPPLA